MIDMRSKMKGKISMFFWILLLIGWLLWQGILIPILIGIILIGSMVQIINHFVLTDEMNYDMFYKPEKIELDIEKSIKYNPFVILWGLIKKFNKWLNSLI